MDYDFQLVSAGSYRSFPIRRFSSGNSATRMRKGSISSFTNTDTTRRGGSSHVSRPRKNSGNTSSPPGANPRRTGSAPGLPALLSSNGFVFLAAPLIFCVRPNDYMWQWPATFIAIYLPRLIEMGRIDQKFADQVRGDLASAEENANALMITPLVLEIVAEKL
jgi:hypothetical protein